VQPLLLGGDARDRRVQVELPNGRPPGQIIDSPTCLRHQEEQPAGEWAPQ
jgi:hypothetical protein